MGSRRVVVLAIALLAVAGCQRACARDEDFAPFAAWGPGDAGPPATVVGSLTVGRRAIDLGIYLQSAPSMDQVALAQEAAKKHLPGVTILTSPERVALPTALVFSPKSSLPPPTLEQLRFDGRGIHPGQAEVIASSKGLVAIVLRLDEDPTLARLHGAQELALEIGRAGLGVIWDESTREVYALDEWQKVRVDGWEAEHPEVRRHIALRYDDSHDTPGGRNRLVTLGMVKFGLPDLVLDDVLPNEIGGATRVLDGIAQLLVEGAPLGPAGVLRFDLGAVQHQGARQAFLAKAGSSAKLQGAVTLVPVSPAAGDPENRMVSVHFPLYDQLAAADRAGANGPHPAAGAGDGGADAGHTETGALPDARP